MYGGLSPANLCYGYATLLWSFTIPRLAPSLHGLGSVPAEIKVFRTVRIYALYSATKCSYSAPNVVPYSTNMNKINGLTVELYAMFYTVQITNIPTMSHSPCSRLGVALWFRLGQNFNFIVWLQSIYFSILTCIRYGRMIFRSTTTSSYFFIDEFIKICLICLQNFKHAYS